MQRTLIRLFRVCPLPLVYGIMGLVIPFYMLFGKGFRASYRFFRRRIGQGAVHSFFSVYANEFNLGLVVLDRFAAYAGKQFRFDIAGHDNYEAIDASPEGAVMLSSHVGNHELAGYFLKADKRINALVFPGETKTVMEGRGGRFAATNIRMIPIQEDMSHIFALNNALADGEIVSIAGDRAFGSEKRLRVPFFGQEAAFPMGPFAMAAQRQVPMVAVFVMKAGVRRYKIRVEAIPVATGESRGEQMLSLCGAYAEILERNVRAYPHQWYNFYDFWG